MGRITRVIDRNGEVVPFRRSRVVRAILAAVRHAGSKDEWVADKLADMVVYFLDTQHGERPQPPSSEDVDDMIERALLSSPDLAAISQAFIASRRQRRELQQIELAMPDAPQTGPQVAQGAQQIEGWNRARIAAALVRELNLDATRAGEVAQAVEKRVVELNLPRLTTGLIRELVDVELLAQGLAQQPSTLQLPRYDLEQWLFPAVDNDVPPVATQQGLADRAGRRVLSEYTLTGVLPAASRELHLQARLHFDGLDSPAALAGLRLDAVAALSAGAGFGLHRLYPDATRTLADGFERLAALVREAGGFTGGAIVVRGLDSALAAEPEADRAALQQGLRLLAGQCANPLILEVGPPGGAMRDLVIRCLLDALAGSESALRQRVSLCLSVSAGGFGDPARRSLIERAAATAGHCGEPSFRLREPGTTNGSGLFGDPGAARHEATLASAAINMVAPALAARDLSACLAALDTLVDGAVDGLAARAGFLERVAMRTLPDPVPAGARMLRATLGKTREVSLTPVGLATAAALVSGSQTAASEVAQRAAQQMLSYLGFKFRDAAARANLLGVLSGDVHDAAWRMAQQDIARLRRDDPDSPLLLRLAADDAYLGGTGLPWDMPVAARMAPEAALHSLMGRDAVLVAGPAENLTSADVLRLLRQATAEGAPRPTRFSLSVRHRLCRDCGARSVASVDACPACGSTAWAVPPGQKSLFG